MSGSYAQRFLNLLLYGNVWIAVCAAATVLLTEWRWYGALELNAFNGFVFFSTWSLYCLHRIVGMNRVRAFRAEGRYRIIHRFRRHIIFYAVVAALAAVWCFFSFPPKLQRWTLAPALVSVGYVVPVLRGKRLRDFDFWKIFLVAAAFAWVSVTLPHQFHERPGFPSGWMLLEKFLFIFAITIPFDIRDLRVDRHTQVRTLPALLGIRRSRWLALALLVLSTLVYLGGSPVWSGGLLLANGLTATLIWRAGRETEDAYFTGFLDGTMVLQLIGTLLW